VVDTGIVVGAAGIVVAATPPNPAGGGGTVFRSGVLGALLAADVPRGVVGTTAMARAAAGGSTCAPGAAVTVVGRASLTVEGDGEPMVEATGAGGLMPSDSTAVTASTAGFVGSGASVDTGRLVSLEQPALTTPTASSTADQDRIHRV
jgi:hypothetical protein